MKKSILLLAALFLGFTSMNAQWFGNEKVRGNGDVKTITRNTSDYEKINLVGALDVILISGAEGKIKIKAESNLEEFILTEVSNGNLKISVEKGYDLIPSKNNKIIITVPVNEIDVLNVTGSGDLSGTDLIKTKNLSLKVTGSGDMHLNLDVDDLEGTVTGSGDISLEGTATNFNCKVNGSGDFKAYNLEAKNVDARVSGSGDIKVYATEMLTARVAGSGDISYKGNPAKENFKTTGTGSISSN